MKKICDERIIEEFKKNLQWKKLRNNKYQTYKKKIKNEEKLNYK
jgi:hypothetical protein